MEQITVLERKWELERDYRDAERALVDDEKALVDAQHNVEASLRERNEAREKLDAFRKQHDLL